MPTAPLPLRTDRLLERFLRYVRVETTANPEATSYPSSEGQRELAQILANELSAMGLDDVQLTEDALVIATIPATIEGDLPVVALVAHMDTSPDASGANVSPQVIEQYTGGDIPLANGKVITVADCRELESMVGETLITTDGTTLLGGDDKAGVAIIMEVAHTLVERPDIPHGPVRVVMTCDEEIGFGTDKIDLNQLDATVAYTVDGGGRGELDVETFSADAMTVKFEGYNIHPAIAKDRMRNSIRAAATFIASLPQKDQTPETTDERDGFIHVNDVVGGVGETRINLLLRSFDSEELGVFADQVRKLANQAAESIDGMKCECLVRRQYRNLRDGLEKLPEAVDLAEQAYQILGIESNRAIIRGGTDGSQLSEKGLPTPNLSSGQHNIHSVLEFANLNEMTDSASHLIELLRLWGEKRS
ncbi:tripeptide aminopeptidase [Neorhodopirellula lusitana]|uniref:Peptidase T n=1 Tax=Neorhodopirellula lusitana TaxID=445327 RepID=A0ABY1PS90_9BACT|nr:peptidase T [Neorhodopirellula lusitana]SMP44261.1 tripeptide aminopeptidase [Neorhodopirellula lusitana]